MAFDLMRRALLTRGAKRRQVQIYLSDCLFMFGSSTYALSQRLARVSVLCLSCGIRAVEVIPAQSFGHGLQLDVIRLAESTKCRFCSTRLPAALWRARHGRGGGSGGGEGQKIESLPLNAAGPNTQAKKSTSKSTIRSTKKSTSKSTIRSTKKKHQQKHNQEHKKKHQQMKKKAPAKAQSGAQKKAPAKAQSGAPGKLPGVCSNLVV